MSNKIEALIADMKAAAEIATGGKWVRESGEGWDAICSDDDQLNSGFIVAEFQGPEAQENRIFAQSANPANVLVLIAALEQAQQELIKPLAIGELIHRLENQTGEKWVRESEPNGMMQLSNELAEMKRECEGLKASAAAITVECNDVITCWACKESMALLERSGADGFCPHCDAEIDMQDDRAAGGTAEGSE